MGIPGSNLAWTTEAEKMKDEGRSPGLCAAVLCAQRGVSSGGRPSSVSAAIVGLRRRVAVEVGAGGPSAEALRWVLLLDTGHQALGARY